MKRENMELWRQGNRHNKEISEAFTSQENPREEVGYEVRDEVNHDVEECEMNFFDNEVAQGVPYADILATRLEHETLLNNPDQILK